MWEFFRNTAGYSKAATSAAISHNKDFEWMLIKVLLKLLVLITGLWVINILGLQALNLIPFFVITILLIAIGFSPIALSATALAGVLTRADQIKGMPAGIPAGAQIWIAQVLPAIIVSCHILIGFLATWSFAANPIAFWYFAMACMTICSAVLAWKKMEGDFLYKLVVGYSAVVAIFALVTTQWPEAGKMLDHEGRVELRQQQAAAVRQTEIAQAVHQANVATARAQAQALKPAPDHQVVQGIDHLAGKNAGLYDFLIGEPNVLNARAITLKPNQYFDAALDPNRSTPRCTGVYPKRAGLGFTEVPGADRVSNTGDAVFTVISYEYPIGSTDPFGNKCS